MTAQVEEIDERVGWLVYVRQEKQEGYAVVCDKCTTALEDKPRPDIELRTPIYLINIAPYKQHCFTCGDTLVCGRTEAWPELFEPKLK